MRARAETIGATLTIGARPDGHGTQVQLTVPTQSDEWSHTP